MLPDWINGGFFVFRREIFDWLEKDDPLETGCFRRLAEAGELMAYRHEGFWTCMDTYKDNLRLNEMWERNNAPGQSGGMTDGTLAGSAVLVTGAYGFLASHLIEELLSRGAM